MTADPSIFVTMLCIARVMVLQRFWQSSVQLAKSSINFFLAPSLSFARENPQPVWMECTGGRISGVDWAGLSGLLMYGGWNFMGSGQWRTYRLGYQSSLLSITRVASAQLKY